MAFSAQVLSVAAVSVLGPARLQLSFPLPPRADHTKSNQRTVLRPFHCRSWSMVVAASQHFGARSAFKMRATAPRCNVENRDWLAQGSCCQSSRRVLVLQIWQAFLPSLANQTCAKPYGACCLFFPFARGRHRLLQIRYETRRRVWPLYHRRRHKIRQRPDGLVMEGAEHVTNNTPRL